MNLRSLIVSCLFISLIQTIQAQTARYNPFFYEANRQQSADLTPMELISLGTYFYDKKWNAGNIYLANGDTLVAYYMRYDIVRNQLEVIIDKRIKAIHGTMINAFQWFDPVTLQDAYFMHSKQFVFEDPDIKGFVEVVKNGKMKLLKYKKVMALRESTSPSLVNDTDSDIQVSEKFYLAKGGRTHRIGNGKKKNIGFIDSKQVEVFINDSKLRFGSEKDLKAIVNYYNKL